MKLIVAGSRDFTDYQTVCRVLDPTFRTTHV